MKTTTQYKGYRSYLRVLDSSPMNAMRSDKGCVSCFKVIYLSLFVPLYVMSNFVFNVYCGGDDQQFSQIEEKQLNSCNKDLKMIQWYVQQNFQTPCKSKSINTGGGLGMYFNLSKTNSVRVSMGLEALCQYNLKSIPNASLVSIDQTTIGGILSTLDRHLMLCGIYLPVLRLDIGRYFYISGPLVGLRFNLYSVSEGSHKRKRITLGVTVGTELGLNIHKYLSIGLRIEWDPYNSRIKYNQIIYSNSKPFTVSVCLRAKMPTEKLSVHIIYPPISCTLANIKTGHNECVKKEVQELLQQVTKLRDTLGKTQQQ